MYKFGKTFQKHSCPICDKRFVKPRDANRHYEAVHMVKLHLIRPIFISLLSNFRKMSPISQRDFLPLKELFSTGTIPLRRIRSRLLRRRWRPFPDANSISRDRIQSWSDIRRGGKSLESYMMMMMRGKIRIWDTLQMTTRLGKGQMAVFNFERARDGGFRGAAQKITVN